VNVEVTRFQLPAPSNERTSKVCIPSGTPVKVCSVSSDASVQACPSMRYWMEEIPEVGSEEDIRTVTDEVTKAPSDGDTMLSDGIIVSTTNDTETVALLPALSVHFASAVCGPSARPAKSWLIDWVSDDQAPLSMRY